MTADLQNFFVNKIVPAIATGSMSGSQIDDTIKMFVKDKINSVNPFSIPPTSTPIVIDRMIITEISNMRNITQGAKNLIREAENINLVISLIFQDKLFKSFLREALAQEPGCQKLDSFISNAAKISTTSTGYAESLESRRVGKPTTIQEKSHFHITQNKHNGPHASVAGNPKAKKIQNVTTIHKEDHIEEGLTTNNERDDWLNRYGKYFIEYDASGVRKSFRVSEILLMLAENQLSPELSQRISVLLLSDVAYTIAHIYKMTFDGRVQTTARSYAMICIAAIRYYLSVNAISSAQRVIKDLRSKGGVVETVSSGEELRLLHLEARCNVRSGNSLLALQQYEAAYYLDPTNTVSLMGIVSAGIKSHPELSLSFAKAALINNYEVSDDDLLYIGDLFVENSNFEWANVSLSRLANRSEGNADCFVGFANLALAMGRTYGWAQAIKKYIFMASGLIAEINRNNDSAFNINFPNISSDFVDHPKISVIMTTYNAQNTLESSINSVLSQTTKNIELIIVDDCSSDQSSAIAKRFADSDPRIITLTNEKNLGTYVSKNRGVSVACGEYVTFHDSDDFMFPNRLEEHLKVSRDGIICSTSNWLRMDCTGKVIVRRGGPYTHLNPASTFFLRSFLNEVGLFDNVRTGADAEITARIKFYFGKKSICNISKCLGFGLHHAQSLTQSGSTAFDEFRYSPVRLSYTEAWMDFYIDSLYSDPRKVPNRELDGIRAFKIPQEIVP